jgi:N6-L-threonylcarbamoyladenine synthase
MRSICDVIYRATENAMKKYPGIPVVFSGGVASNSMLRSVMSPLDPVFAQPQYSTDNAMGVAVLTYLNQGG